MSSFNFVISKAGKNDITLSNEAICLYVECFTIIENDFREVAINEG